MIWLDHRREQTLVVSFAAGGLTADNNYNDAAEATGKLSTSLTTLAACCHRGAHAPSVADDVPCHFPEGVAVDCDDEAFATRVESLKKHIVAGDVFQIVASRTFSLPCARPLAAYRELRAVDCTPYMFYVVGSAGILFGASPETALRVSGHPRRVEIRPIAGTRPRARRPDGTIDDDLDGRIEAGLRLDEKEVAEHMMLVDLARNDTARVSKPGTRKVDRLLGVDRYAYVMHLVSHVNGELRDDLDALHAYVATMNMGTLVGAPKLEAATLLRRYEPTLRGPYGGAVGYLTCDGRMDTAIIIRSTVVRGNTAFVRAGAGLVFDSVPQAEADETKRKATAVLHAITRASEKEQA